MFRIKFLGLKAHAYTFSKEISTLQWLEQNVFPPKDLTALTMIFQLHISSAKPPIHHPFQIACYGNSGDDCRFSVAITVNLTLEVIIESKRLVKRISVIFRAVSHEETCTFAAN